MPLDQIKAALKQLGQEPESSPQSNVLDLLKSQTPITPQTLQYKTPRKPSPLYKPVYDYIKHREKIIALVDFCKKLSLDERAEIFPVLYSALLSVSKESLDPHHKSYDFTSSPGRQSYLQDRRYFKEAYLMVMGQDIESNETLSAYLIENDYALVFEQSNAEMTRVKDLRHYLLTEKFVKLLEDGHYEANDKGTYYLKGISNLSALFFTQIDNKLMRLYFISDPHQRMALIHLPGMQEQVLMMHGIYQKLVSFNETCPLMEPPRLGRNIRATLSFRRPASQPINPLQAEEDYIRRLLTKPGLCPNRPESKQ
jgi:hypothetical protein